jgi:transcriptional regulator with XRE-family HTH domain
MTASEFRSALKELGITQFWLAIQLGVAISTVNRWATGEVPVSPYVPFVLKLLSQLRTRDQEIREKLISMAAEYEHDDHNRKSR